MNTINSKFMKSNDIPKIVHQIWIGEKMPDYLKLYTNDWEEMRGWDYKLWGNADMKKENFPKTWFLIKEILELEKPVYAMISDLMRLEILYTHGGVYLDTTFEKVKNITKLLDKKGYEFVVSNEISDPNLDLDYMSNSFIASVPHHIVLKRLLSPRYLYNIDINNEANEETGPFYLRTGIQNKKEINLIPTELIYPYSILDWYDNVTSPCISYSKKKGFKKYKFRKGSLYIKYPCKHYPDAFMIKQWNLGGTWLKQ
tara:strand:+ start:1446 stop:2213 length:768 start_codon:yes stop_codon:yes gene_type:complete